MHGRHRRGVNREHGRERVGVLTRHDPEERIALRGVCTFVDEGEGLAIPFVNRSRPLEDRADLKAVERRLTVAALVDLDASHGVTMTLVGKRVALTRAT